MERTNFYDAVYSPVVLLLNAVVVGIVMLLSASGNARILSLFGMSVGTSVAVINYISRIFAPIESLGMEIQTIQSAMAGVRRIDAFLAQPERAVPKRNETAARGDVALSHVTFGYGEKPVLRDFSMTVRQGEQVMPVGRTGAGKSTVFKLLLGLYQPEAGTVTIGGVDVSRISDQERRTCIGCVEQHFSRVPGSVLDQITPGDPQITAAMAKNAAQLAGIDAARAGIQGKVIDAAARKVITDAGYGEYFGHGFGHSLGLDIHERPNANPAGEAIMPEGSVCSAEPGIYIPGRFGVRIEDVMILRENGAEVITRSPKELIIL